MWSRYPCVSTMQMLDVIVSPSMRAMQRFQKLFNMINSTYYRVIFGSTALRIQGALKGEFKTIQSENKYCYQRYQAWELSLGGVGYCTYSISHAYYSALRGLLCSFKNRGPEGEKSHSETRIAITAWTTKFFSHSHVQGSGSSKITIFFLSSNL